VERVTGTGVQASVLFYVLPVCKLTNDQATSWRWQLVNKQTSQQVSRATATKVATAQVTIRLVSEVGDGGRLVWKLTARRWKANEVVRSRLLPKYGQRDWLDGRTHSDAFVQQ
jgi:hypothetical protein